MMVGAVGARLVQVSLDMCEGLEWFGRLNRELGGDGGGTGLGIGLSDALAVSVDPRVE